VEVQKMREGIREMACLVPLALVLLGAALAQTPYGVEGKLTMAGKRLPVRLEGRLEPTPEGFCFVGVFTTRFSEWGLERPRFLFPEVADRVEVFLEALLRRR
jgi:polyisoprenoid-binding protein YceI